MWQLARNISTGLIGGFGGYPVRHEITGQLGYFKPRKFKWDVVCSTLAGMVGVVTPKIEIARIGVQHGAVSHFWGGQSLDIVQVAATTGSYSDLTALSGYLAFIYWIGYCDLRNEHLLWSKDGIALIDFDDAFTWRYLNLNHIIGPSALMKFFDPLLFKATVDKISALTHHQILRSFTSMMEGYRFYPEEEERFSSQLYSLGQEMAKRLQRYWVMGIVDRNVHPQLSIQDERLWRKPDWRRFVEACHHDYMQKEGVWLCQHCDFIWPLLGTPET